MSRRVLIIEDNPSLSMALKRILSGFCKIEQVPTLTGAFNHVAETREPYDAVILDRVLPDGDGLEFLEYIRSASPQTLVCILSSKTLSAEKITGLQTGADCYLPKPMSAQEFRWHFSSLLQRDKHADPRLMMLGELVMDLENATIKHRQESSHLTKRELQVMKLFLQQPQSRVSLEQIESIFHHDMKERPNAVVHVMVQRLRKKLKPLQFTLASRYGSGYQLVAQPTRV